MSGTAARREMVDAAERLIAERGLAAVSLRDVQIAAGQRNKSAANYHFGSREGLIAAIVEARMGPVNERRLAMLAAQEARGQVHDVRALVEALVLPLAEQTLSRPDSCYARFLAQLVTDPSTEEPTRRYLWPESLHIVRDRLVEALVMVPEPLRRGRVDRAFGLAITSLAAWEGRATERSTPVEARVHDLVDTCAGLVAAPVSLATHEVLGTGHGREVTTEKEH